MFFTEASFYGLWMVLIFYFLRHKKGWMYFGYALLSLFPVFFQLGSEEAYAQLFLFDYQWMMVFALPFFIFYNGKKGYSAEWAKWMFYVFYPLHLILIVLIGRSLA